MSLLLESIRVENRKASNLLYHQRRFDKARKEVLGINDGLELETILQAKLEALRSDGLYKCRVEYDTEIQKIEFLPYQIRPINSLKMVYNNKLSYAHKWSDRKHLDQLFLQKKNCDDILLIKDGMVTDSYYCNIIFWSGKRWLTPAKPLLEGTQRQYLYEEAIISKAIIRGIDIPKFKTFKLVNAMIPFELAPEIPVSHIQ